MQLFFSILTPALTILLVGLILPQIAAARQKADQLAADMKCVCYSHGSILAMRILSVVSIILTIVLLVCTVLSIIDPEMMDTTSDDIGGIVATWILSVALDVFTIVWTIKFTRKIYYNNTTITEIQPFNKKQEFLLSDITSIRNTVALVIGQYPPHRKGKLEIYFGEKCIKIRAQMHGVNELIAMLYDNCPELING